MYTIIFSLNSLTCDDLGGCGCPQTSTPCLRRPSYVHPTHTLLLWYPLYIKPHRTLPSDASKSTDRHRIHRYPQPMPASGQSDLPTPLTVQKWHPKLTPYRLLALGTTVAVGTAKAVAAQKGDNGASTTLEWISGVVIFLV